MHNSSEGSPPEKPNSTAMSAQAAPSWLRPLAALVLLLLVTAILVKFPPVRLTFVVGMLLLGMSALMPMREEDEPRDLLWDAAGWVSSLFIGLVLGRYLHGPVVELIRRIDGIAEMHRRLLELPDWILVGLILVVMDFFCYWAHRALHSRYLWSHHAWHHAPRYLNWLAGTRTTFVNYLVLNIVPAIVVGVLYPMPRARPAILVILVLPRLADLLHHSNLWLPGARYLEYLVVTPRFHFVHHHRERRFSDRNLGFLFTFWDRLFGTYVAPGSLQANYPLGIGYENENWRLMLGLPPAEDSSKG